MPFLGIERAASLLALGGALLWGAASAEAAQVLCAPEADYWLSARGLYCRLAGAPAAAWKQVGHRPDGLQVTSRGVLAWREGEVWQVWGGEISVLARLAQPIRALAEMPGGTLILLVGGRQKAGRWHGAQVAFWRPGEGEGWASRRVTSALNPFLLRVARCGAQQVVFVGVQKTARFDPVWRGRPFIYSYSPPRRDLVPRWQGTTLARPYLDVQFADLEGDGEPELWALETTQNGWRRIVAYRWTGQGLEGLGQSAPLPLGNQLAVAPVVSAARQVLVAFTAEGGQWAARAWGAGEDRGEATLAEPRLLGQSVRLRARPLAWGLRRATAGSLPEVLVVLASGPPRLLPWQTTR